LGFVAKGDICGRIHWHCHPTMWAVRREAILFSVRASGKDEPCIARGFSLGHADVIPPSSDFRPRGHLGTSPIGPPATGCLCGTSSCPRSSVLLRLMAVTASRIARPHSAQRHWIGHTRRALLGQELRRPATVRFRRVPQARRCIRHGDKPPRTAAVPSRAATSRMQTFDVSRLCAVRARSSTTRAGNCGCVLQQVLHLQDYPRAPVSTLAGGLRELHGIRIRRRVAESRRQGQRVGLGSGGRYAPKLAGQQRRRRISPAG